MSRKFVNLEITLIYLILLIPWPQTNVIKLICSKDNSRLVRKIIRSKWTPILDKYQMKLPLECPLHPLRDIFGPRQDAKKRHRPTQWTCRLCGKSFFQEKFVDNHFEMRHKHLVNKADDAVCYADFCDVMRCDVFQSEEASLTGGDSHPITDIEVWGDSFGQSSAIAKANAAYLSLIPLRQSAVGASRAAKTQSHQLCQEQNSQSSTFVNVNKPAAKEKSDKSKAKSNTSSMKDDEMQSNTSEDASNQNESVLNIQKKANCQSDALSKLKMRCEHLVRSCIGGLLLQMSDQKFKEMENEMNKAVCWYLSCDRYWEDGPLEPRAFPWGLILILITVLSLGICFCYYIIWILFDSEESTIINNSVQPLSGYHHSPRYIPHRQDISDMRDNINRLSSVAIMDCDKDGPVGKYTPAEATILRSSDINEIAHNDHYIYVTYPPELKKRLFENYE